MLELDVALQFLSKAARIPASTRSQPLSECLGKILAADLVAEMDVPGFDNSAMDGYALHVGDFTAPAETYPLVGRVAAGETAAKLDYAMAVRIFTGAPVPAGANAIVMQEDCTVEGNSVRVDGRIKAGMNIRRRGEDIASSSVVLTAGSRITPQAMALAASIGASHLTVYAPLRVALLSTGSELVEPGHALDAAKIYNSNRYALRGLLQMLGCELSDYGIVEDSLETTLMTLKQAAAHHDVVISSGGVSVGEEDHVKAALQQLGTLDLWKINIKPGKPFALGRIGEADFIGLPGNPVSCFVTFLLLACPFLRQRQGERDVAPVRLRLPAAFEWAKADKRRNFLRARLNAEGAVELFPHQGSGVMTSLVWSHGLVEIAPGQTVSVGTDVSYLPLAQFMA